MDNILITGGAGFIGSNLSLKLEDSDHKVTVIDNLSSGNFKNLKGFKGTFIKKDILDKSLPDKKFDIIFHLAAITDTTYNNDKEMLRQNTEGFKNILTLALKNNSKLIYASSASVYGNGKAPMAETQKPIPLNAYARSKLEIDNLASKFFNKMHIVGLRYFNVFGPGEKYKGKSASMILQLTNKMLSGQNPRLFRFGQQKRDFIYIKDVIQATLNAINAKMSGVYNVGTGTATSFNEIVKILNTCLNTDYQPLYFMNKKIDSYQKNTKADTLNSKRNLDFQANYKLPDAIKIYVDYIKKM
ncbi:ADP-glyceromanno-heptose 6-epimerase [Candidatus Curtissbacteria bacterium RBG_13_35_7]|uniref:ADP-glyceromanno-heptose 6-epimerase n=1 Tax=Candidatus Curtissbacteria bacterium RBG_13_35_7 TaxID=1797705 RepID=A0A1F5G5D5_9BACT|nr:MAG: ADP-glyceromanno-heptose 6-epimerase [Candidatus Curtissbacteria bacterium RBG_13_35_7]